MKAEKIYDQKLLAYVYFFLDYNPKISNKETFVNDLIKNLRETSVGFAGFRKREHFKRYLEYSLFDESLKKLPEYKFNRREIKSIIKSTLIKCNRELPSNSRRIFIFPSFRSFVKEKMRGVNGISLYKRTFVIEINPTAKDWKNSLKKVICHEYNHSVAQQHHNWNSLLDSLIFEGFAEHFREQVVGGERAPWTKAVSEKNCKKYFNQLKPRLNSKSYKLYDEVFYGIGNCPLWLGYSLGYQIVGSFLNKNKELSWPEIIKLRPKKILRQSNF